mmetsp:Transcript_46237/g.154271  ORF Transcript_46237/g.154271 Transcript_46237/m.154271 type:complete len:225 (+) Transcript_46237:111-785(+)
MRRRRRRRPHPSGSGRRLAPHVEAKHAVPLAGTIAIRGEAIRREGRAARAAAACARRGAGDASPAADEDRRVLPAPSDGRHCSGVRPRRVEPPLSSKPSSPGRRATRRPGASERPLSWRRTRCPARRLLRSHRWPRDYQRASRGEDRQPAPRSAPADGQTAAVGEGQCADRAGHALADAPRSQREGSSRCDDGRGARGGGGRERKEHNLAGRAADGNQGATPRH